MRRDFIILFSAFNFFLMVQPVLAQKNDLIFLKNGDRVTGEIKELSYGKICLSTDDIGTIYIEWDKIERLISDKKFEVELQFGTIYYGSLGVSSDKRKMSVIGDTLTFDVYRAFVVNIRPIRDTFLQRLDGSISLDLSITKTTGVKQLIFGGNVIYQGRIWSQSVDMNAQITTQPEKDISKRAEFNYQANRHLKSRWFSASVFSLTQNTELGIDLRASIGAGGGRKLIQTNNALFRSAVLISITREAIHDSAGVDHNIELPVLSLYRLFMFDDPKTDITVNVGIFPNLSTIGRIRFEINSKLSYEFIKDFSARLNFYYTLDNRPPSTTAAKNDYTLSTGVAYAF
jgi:hypothetical protein